VLNVVQRVCAGSLVDSLVNDDTTPDGGRWMSIVPSSTARIGEIALTRREVEVLHLMAMGKSNRDIADSLYISIPTVKRHVTNILGKLGVSSRYEAASFARSNGFE
jgi:DNA-binding NarL/FixJ family response regulator